jgi:transposase
VRDCRHETVLEGPEVEGAGGRRRGLPREEVARIFGVSSPTIQRYLRLRRQTGDVEPRPVPGPPARKGRMLEERLPAQARTHASLVAAIGRALEAVSSREALGWFDHCGYPLDAQLT